MKNNKAAKRKHFIFKNEYWVVSFKEQLLQTPLYANISFILFWRRKLELITREAHCHFDLCSLQSVTEVNVFSHLSLYFIPQYFMLDPVIWDLSEFYVGSFLILSSQIYHHLHVIILIKQELCWQVISYQEWIINYYLWCYDSQEVPKMTFFLKL